MDRYLDNNIKKCEFENFDYVITNEGIYIIKQCPNCGEDRYIRFHSRKQREGFCSVRCKNEYHGLWENNKGRIPWNKGKVGIMPIPWNKGIHIQTNTGKTHFKKGQNIGEKHPRWKGGNSKRYPTIKLDEWKRMVFIRDNYTCQICHSRNHKGLGYTITLNAHHIKSWKDYPKERYNIDNGITLCRNCHMKTHKTGLLQLIT